MTEEELDRVEWNLSLTVEAHSRQGAIDAAETLVDQSLGAGVWETLTVKHIYTSLSSLKPGKEDAPAYWDIALTNRPVITSPPTDRWDVLTPPGFPRIKDSAPGSTPAELQKLRDEQAFLRLEGVNPKMLEMLDDFQQNEGFTPLVDEQELLG